MRSYQERRKTGHTHEWLADRTRGSGTDCPFDLYLDDPGTAALLPDAQNVKRDSNVFQSQEFNRYVSSK